MSNDGGPAFPGKDHMGDGPSGMSLRDWFAGSIPVVEEMSQSQAVALMGEHPPQWGVGEDMKCVIWWAQAEAKLRYINADAMIKAREKNDA